MKSEETGTYDSSRRFAPDWLQDGTSVGVNLDGAGGGEWSPPRIDVFLIAPGRWAYGFSRGNHDVHVRGGLHGSLEDAKRAAILDALFFFPRSHRPVLLALLDRCGGGRRLAR
jgi:hypothetical protein